MPEGIEFDGSVYWSTCPECGYQQGDMGNNVACADAYNGRLFARN